MSQLDLKLPAGKERETHELYLRERGRERKLRKKERPANILLRYLLQAGYDETDGYDLHSGASMAGVPFLLKFVYRSQFLGSAVRTHVLHHLQRVSNFYKDADLSFNNYEYINLSGRSLRAIPVALYQHADSIVSLHLSRNPMLEIPRDFIQSCTPLSKLYLSHMFMKKVPHSIRHSATLTLLDLSSNRIVSLDEGHLDELPRLTTLHVQNNRLERLPPSLPRGLMELNISNNVLSEFPLAVTALANLSTLDISFNSITTLPAEIGHLDNLVQLIMVDNRVAQLPAEFGNLTRLCELDCRRNRIADLAIACMLPELATLTADHNSLHGLALTLGPNLATLDVSHSDITELSVARTSSLLDTRPCALTSLDVSNAKLSVLDDGAFAALDALRTLKLDRNELHALPAALGDLKWLETLSCADNRLSALPAAIGRLQKLEALDVHGNSLMALPAELWNCASLARLNATSNMLEVWHDPPPFGPLPATGTPAFTPRLRRAPVVRQPDIPPLVHSLEALYLAENKLTDEAIQPLMLFKELRVLNLSLNDLQEIPGGFFRRLMKLEELYLGGNRLTRFPISGEELSEMGRLSTLFLNGNRLSHLPPELGKVKSLSLLDVGNNHLKYNINNLDYDWNWNFNKNLVFLNLSGNKQLEIKSDVSTHGRPSTSSLERRALSGFSGLPRLRVLGLMDVTITTNTLSDIPDESDERRVRTSSSLVNGLSYGISDTLGCNPHHHMMDLVHEFRGIKKDTVFAMFGRALPNEAAGTTMHSTNLAKFLKDNFIRVFIAQLNNALNPQRREGVPDALRRTFLKLNQEYHDVLFGPARKMSMASAVAPDASLLHHSASGIVVYIVDKRLYVANVGQALAVVSRMGNAQHVSRKHVPYDRPETARIRAADGWISPTGLVNGELDVSRSFGYYHLLPAVNARPDVCEYMLTSRDDFVIIANRGLWDYVEFQTAVDIVMQDTEPMAAAQKLRDIAISCGADGSTMVMVVSLANLFKENTPAKEVQDELVTRQWQKRRGHFVADRTLDRLRGEVPPPEGNIAIVFTDIQGSTPLWVATPAGMITAIHLHNNLLRRYLRQCGGYEVRTEGDSFFCAFPTVLAAVRWCLTIQVELLGVSWPQDILECADGRVVYDEQEHLIYRGLSVRMGIHCGSPLCQRDPVTTRMDYFGLVVTRASRISSIAAGGQIMCSADVLSEINAHVVDKEPATEYSDLQLKENVDAIRILHPVVVPQGEVKLKGLELPENLSYILPEQLVARKDYKKASTVVPTIADGLSFRPVGPQTPHQCVRTSIRELAMLCVRLELATDDGRHSDASVLHINDDLSVLLPSNLDVMTEKDLVTVLYSLTVRIENVERIFRLKTQSLVPPLVTTDALVAALRGLDARTLKEMWSMVA
ncbi:hypothetical protein GGX14DRAFT_360142 [Mycena pura]|uniref:Adenylate cyclase n=1 Tax=Mycena pura TaxID=153505 RepID=A0AAD6VJ20_9AGAR|nr:hypothetical protein GGX14DRAFT_360142 [Mycena pura]